MFRGRGTQLHHERKWSHTNNVIKDNAVYADDVFKVCPVALAMIKNTANVAKGASADVLLPVTQVNTSSLKCKTSPHLGTPARREAF